MAVIIMGVAGSGKTTLGRALAAHLHRPFLDADDFHDAAALARMARGEGLSAAQRAPWLARLRAALHSTPRAVLACSALTRAARDALRGPGHLFLFLQVTPAALHARLEARRAHPVGLALLPSQLRTLEAPQADESDILTLNVTGDPPAAVLRRALHALDGQHV